jgi:ADP-ribose pyrophosphatase YjhB (NUDIX family)
VGVVVIRGGKVLLGLRRGSHGAGTWALPGGHLEWGETVENCARREVKEETGLDLGLVGQGPYTSDVMATEGKHYVTCFVEAAALPAWRACNDVVALDHGCEREAPGRLNRVCWGSNGLAFNTADEEVWIVSGSIVK